ncbi:MAG: peptidase T4 [Rhodobacterales bacterium]|nr:MAG: peptidase T4 [Rhodobacterales bacterium]
MKPGAMNLITDVAGLRVGNAEDAHLKSGVSVLLGEEPFTAAVHVMGGAPGSRETDLLAPDKMVQQVDALVLSGGSAFGLDAASGVVEGLRQQGRGFDVGGQTVPIVPAAILFDLLNGGDKNWDHNPYGGLGWQALAKADPVFELGSHGAGAGATVEGLKGGLGSASLVLECGVTIGALVAVNALGAVTVGDGPEFWAKPFEMEGEFGNGPLASHYDPGVEPHPEAQLGQNTTIAIVATDAQLTQAQTQRMATAAHDGMARAIVPSHTPFDGDLIFGLSTGARELPDPVFDPIRLGHGAAVCLARAIARGVFAASPAEGDVLPTWKQKFGG